MKTGASFSAQALILIVAILAGVSAHAKDAHEDCIGDLTFVDGAQAALKDWEDLPLVWDSPLSAETRAVIDAHPLTAKLRARFKLGRNLTFQSDPIGRRGGWLIQGLLLDKIIKHIFPGAKILKSRQKEGAHLDLADSTARELDDRPFFDMVDLKILNSGPLVPGAAQLRDLLSLPRNSRIASVYDALKHSVNSREIVRALFDNDVVDIVILSSQTDGARHEKFGWHNEVPLFESVDWLAMRPADRPARAVIYNDTRNRLPFIHGAADFVVVTGEANIFEPIFAGRPTYFDKKGWSAPRSSRAWQRIGDVAERSWYGFPILSTEDLLAHRLNFKKPKGTVSGAGAISTADQQLALQNILQTLSKLIAD